MKVRRETQRPEGLSISWSQVKAALTCGLRLKFHRQRISNGRVGIFLLYGIAFHAGVEARARGLARDDEEAVIAALARLRSEIAGSRLPVGYDDPWEVVKAGTPTAESYGNLCSPEACEWWLRRQVPSYLRRFPDQQVRRSEHQLFAALTPPPGANWKRNWSFQAYLDREMVDGSIHDIKTTQSAWDAGDVRKNAAQAHLYMAVYYHHYGRPPTHFEFHVIPRVRDTLKDGSLDALDLVQVFRIEWSPALIQRILDNVIKPIVSSTEAGNFAANPASALCSDRYCGYWKHCAFGEGENL